MAIPATGSRSVLQNLEGRCMSNSSYTFDEFCVAALGGSGAPFNWATDDIWCGIYTDAVTVSKATDYATLEPLFLAHVAVTGRSVTSTGVASADAIQFVGITTPPSECISGVVFYREADLLIINIAGSSGTDCFDGLVGMFGMGATNVDFTLKPRASDNGWFRL
jgi:hypothetical protein